MPQVSIVMPAFNAAEHISDAIDSVIEQSFTDWELLVADDGSTDDTRAIVQSYVLRDSRITLHRNDLGKGPASARNCAASHATGEYLAFLDADDLWTPPKLQLQIELMTALGLHFTYTGYDHIDTNGIFISRISVPSEINYSGLKKGNVIATATVMIRRSSFQDLVMPDFPRAQDFALWLKLLREVEVAHGLTGSLSKYRITPNTGNRRKLFALKHLYEIYTKQEGDNPFAALALILKMYLHRRTKYR